MDIIKNTFYHKDCKLTLATIYTFRWFIFALSVRQILENLALAKLKDSNEAIRANINHPSGKNI